MVEKNELHDDDIVLEKNDENAQDQDLELEAEEELTGDKLKSLRHKLKASESEKMATLEELARVRADFLNSKRRLEEQFKNDKERIVEKVVMDFIPLIDSFETALLHAQSEEGEWKKGVEAMHSQFLSILKSYGIEEIDAEGSISTLTNMKQWGRRRGGEPDTIIQVLQKGYMRGDTVIRPAKVIIAS